MSMIDSLRRIFYEPEVRGLDVDENNLLEVHRKILLRKELLKSTFETFYSDMTSLCDRHLIVPGTEIELGSGAGFFKNYRKGLITSDIRRGEYIDIILDAQNMSIPDNSVRCIYAINVFHHLSDPEKFFSELCRVLRPEGGCILIEPHGGFASALLHRYLHHNEQFDPTQGWKTKSIGGPLSGANQALAHIIFSRDIDMFRKKYGNQLTIVYQGYILNSLRYFFSGGLNFKQMLPSRYISLLRKVENLGKPLARYWTFHQIIVIKKSPNNSFF